MSSSLVLCCLPSVIEEAKTWFPFFFVRCIIKQLLDSAFMISRIIKVWVRVTSLSLRLRPKILTLTLIILDITKTSSDNCLLSIFHNRDMTWRRKMERLHLILKVRTSSNPIRAHWERREICVWLFIYFYLSCIYSFTYLFIYLFCPTLVLWFSFQVTQFSR